MLRCTAKAHMQRLRLMQGQASRNMLQHHTHTRTDTPAPNNTTAPYYNMLAYSSQASLRKMQLTFFPGFSSPRPPSLRISTLRVRELQRSPSHILKNCVKHLTARRGELKHAVKPCGPKTLKPWQTNLATIVGFRV